jgi:diketogulonate reductase-like aldo/keto reductase
MVGFGTAALGSLQRESIETAIDAGYRLFDSASDTGPWYKTEAVIGSLLKHKHGILFLLSFHFFSFLIYRNA